MSKYSLQTECLESIEAYSDEHINREMDVIESVLEIFDKAVFMMELSNNDVDVPDCSLFMESTFFQEEKTITKENEARTTTNGDPSNTQSTDGSETNQNDTSKQTVNRDEYNKDHNFRRMNDKGKVENLFISILSFIPRLLAYPFRKKGSQNISNAKKETEEAIKEINEAPKEAVEKAVKELIQKGEVSVDDNGTIAAKDENAQISYNTKDGSCTVTSPSTGATEALDQFDKDMDAVKNMDIATGNLPEVKSNESSTNIESKPQTTPLLDYMNAAEEYNKKVDTLIPKKNAAEKKINDEIAKAKNMGDKVSPDLINRSKNYVKMIQADVKNVIKNNKDINNIVDKGFNFVIGLRDKVRSFKPNNNNATQTSADTQNNNGVKL